MTPEQGLIVKQEYRSIDRLLDTLPPRECLAVRWRFGLRCDRAMKYKEMAERYGVSIERMRQITLKGLRIFSFRLAKAEFPAAFRNWKKIEREAAKAKQAELEVMWAKHDEAWRRDKAAQEALVKRAMEFQAEYLRGIESKGFFYFTATRQWYEREYKR